MFQRRTDRKIQIGGDRLRKEIRKYIESELRHYRENRKEIEAMREDIVEGSPGGLDGQPRGPGISNPTERNATRLLTNRRLGKLEETVNAIEIVVEELDEDRRKLIEYTYFKRPRTLTDAGVACRLNVSIRTFYRWRDLIIHRIAHELGLVD